VLPREFRETHPAHWTNAVIYRPKTLVLGLGCDRGAAPEMVERGVLAILGEHRLSIKSVKTIATVDRKADEPAFLYLRDRYDWRLEIYTAAQLDAVPGIENPSETVKRHVGTRGVAEPAALLAARAQALLVPKQIYTEPDAGRSMTLAVARIPYPTRRVAQREFGHG
jgi:cobalt-precorrin 5A hydrolase